MEKHVKEVGVMDPDDFQRAAAEWDAGAGERAEADAAAEAERRKREEAEALRAARKRDREDMEALRQERSQEPGGALFSCPACGNVVSRWAGACPRCGHPIAESRVEKDVALLALFLVKIPLVLIGLSVLVALLLPFFMRAME